MRTSKGNQMASISKYDILAQDITKYLEAKGVYDSVDTTLIDELAFNVSLCDKAKEDINERGLLENIRKKGENPYMQVNQSVSIYNGALKMITAISTKLGLTVLDRTKLKLKDNKKPDSPLNELPGN